jgi:hypothetical protein
MCSTAAAVYGGKQDKEAIYYYWKATIFWRALTAVSKMFLIFKGQGSLS